jgi:transcriptional regulator SbtR-like protein
MTVANGRMLNFRFAQQLRQTEQSPREEQPRLLDALQFCGVGQDPATGAESRQQNPSFSTEAILLAEGANVGAIRNDVAPGELASYCLHALTAASSLPSKAAVRRLVEVTLAGLHPRPI